METGQKAVNHAGQVREIRTVYVELNLGNSHHCMPLFDL